MLLGDVMYMSHCELGGRLVDQEQHRNQNLLFFAKSRMHGENVVHYGKL